MTKRIGVWLSVLATVAGSILGLVVRAQADTTISSGTYQLSAPATTAPSSISGLIVHLDANNVTGSGNPANASALTSWSNLATGNPVGNFSNTGGTPYFNWTGNLMNGNPVVHFWGPQMRTTFNFQTYGTGVTVMYAGRMDGGANNRLVGGGNNWLLGYWGGRQDQAHFDSWISNPTTPADYLTHIYEGTVDSTGTANFYSNGTLIGGPSAGKTRPNGLYLGGYGGGEQSYGDVGEVLVFSRALTTTERQQMEQYLSHKWFGIPDLGPIAITAAGATFDLNGVNQTVDSLTGVDGSHVLLNGAYLTIGQNNASTTFSGDIANGSTSGGGVSKIGTGTLTLAGSSANTFTGPLQFSEGGLALSKNAGVVAIPGNILMVNSLSPTMWMTADNQLGGNGVVTFATEVNSIIGHGRINLRGTTQSVAGIQSNNSQVAGVIQNSETIGGAPSNSGASTLVLTGSGNYSFNGYLRDGSFGTLSVVKNGSGTQVFGGNQITYTGGTTINAGEIQLAGANLGRGAWVINNGGILRGTATDSIDYIQSITVNAGGKIIQSGGSYQQFYNGGAGGTILILNGGSVEATVAPHGNYGNFLLRGNVLVGGTQTSTISADFRMGDNADRIFTVNSTGDPSGIDLDITGNFSHFNGVTWGYMTKEGAGTMRFAATSTNQVGRLTINNGKVLMVDQMSGWGNGGIINNAEFEANIGIGLNKTYASQLIGTGSFTKSGDGTLQFNGGSQVIRQGQFLLQDGTLQNNNNSVNWSTNTGDMDISAGAILDLFADAVYVDQLTGTGIVQNNFGNTSGFSGSGQFIEKLVVGVAGGSSTFDGVIRNNSAGTAPAAGTAGGGISLEKTGTGTLTLTGTLTYTGNTNVNNGALTISGSANLGGSSIFVAPPTSGSATLNVVSGATLSAANLYLFQNSVSNDLATLNQSGGTVTLTGIFQPGASTVGAGGGNVNIANFTGGTFTANTIHLYKWATTTLNLSGPAVVNTSVLDLGWVDSSPTGTINLGDGTTFSGGTNISNGGTSGVLNVGSFTLRSNRNYTLNFKGGTLKASAGGASWLQAGQFTTASVQDAGGIVDNGGNTITIAQVLSHGGVAATDGGLIFQGAGTTTLSAANGFNGGATVRSGTLTLTNNSAAGSGTIKMADANTGASNTTLNFNVGNGNLANAITVSNLGTGAVTLNQGSNFSTLSGLITLNRPTTISSTAGDRTGISGKITGNVGTLTFTGGRTTMDQSAANASDFTGDVVVSTGTLQINSIYGLPSTADVTVIGGSLFRLVSGSGSTVSINGLNGSGNVNGDTGGGHYLKTLSIGNNDGSGNFSGAIADDFGPNSDTVALLKAGNGTQILAGNNTYTGTTTINAGELIVAGSHTGGGDYFVNSGGRLGGKGMIDIGTNTITVAPPSSPPGAISPGDKGSMPVVSVPFGSQAASFSYSAGLDPATVGTLSVIGNVDLGGMLLLDLRSDGQDLLNITSGTFTIVGSDALLEINGTTDLSQIDFWSILGWTGPPASLDLVKFTTFGGGAFDNVAFNEVFNDASGREVMLSFDGDSIFIASTPEPASLALWTLVALGLAVYSYRRFARRS